MYKTLPCTSAHSVQNPASVGGDPVRDGGCSRKVRFTYPALWNRLCRHQYYRPWQRGQTSVELAGEPGKGQPWVRVSTWESLRQGSGHVWEHGPWSFWSLILSQHHNRASVSSAREKSEERGGVRAPGLPLHLPTERPGRRQAASETS